MGALLLSPTIERLAYIDVSFPIVISSFRIVVPWPEAESRLLAPIKPFQWPVIFTRETHFNISYSKLIRLHSSGLVAVAN